MKVIDKDPTRVIPLVKEGDFLICYLRKSSSTYSEERTTVHVGVTEYLPERRRVNIKGANYITREHGSTITDQHLHEWGWEARNLLHLMMSTYQRWRYRSCNYIVEYLVIDHYSDLKLAFNRISDVPEFIKDEIIDEYRQYRGRRGD